jgi:hypothetical protein
VGVDALPPLGVGGTPLPPPVPPGGVVVPGVVVPGLVGPGFVVSEFVPLLAGVVSSPELPVWSSPAPSSLSDFRSLPSLKVLPPHAWSNPKLVNTARRQDPRFVVLMVSAL